MSQIEMFKDQALMPTAPASPEPSPPDLEAARKTSLRITGQLLGELSAAEAMPWDIDELSMRLKMFQVATTYLEPEEAARLGAEMDAELVRLNASPHRDAA